MAMSVYFTPSVHVYKMDYAQGKWESYARGNGTCRLQVISKDDEELFVKITPQGGHMQVRGA